MTVIEGERARLDIADIEERMVFLDLVRPDDVHVETDQLADALDVVEPVDLFVCHRETDAAAAMPAGGLSGQFFKLGIEFGAVMVDMGHRQVADEMRALARRVPGRAGGQLAFLHQDDVGPTLQRQVIKQADAHGAAAHDAHTRMLGHDTSPASFLGRIIRECK